MFSMSSKRRTQAPKTAGRIERHCPDGWIPAWDPDESGPEWWYDKSKYSRTVRPSNEDPHGSPPTPEPIPSEVSEALLAWYTEFSTNEAQQSTGVPQAQTNVSLQAAQHSDQFSPRSASSHPPLRPQSPAVSSQPQTNAKTCLPDARSCFRPPPPQRTPNEYSAYSSSHKAAPPVGLAAPSAYQSESPPPSLNGPDVHQNKGIVELSQPTLPLSVAGVALDRQGTAADKVKREQRASSLLYPMKPMMDDVSNSPSVAQPEQRTSDPTATFLQPKILESRRPQLVTPAATMLQQLMPHTEQAKKMQILPRPGVFRRTASTTPSNVAATSINNGVIWPTRSPSQKRGRYPMLESVVAFVNAGKPQKDADNAASKQFSQHVGIPEAGQVPGQQIPTAKRPRIVYEEFEDKDLERPTKSQRTPYHTHPGSRQPYLAPSPHASELADASQQTAMRAPLPKHTVTLDQISQQQAPLAVTIHNAKISQATLARSLVAEGQIFADPRDPLVAEYIDAWTQDFIRRSNGTTAAAQARPQPHHDVLVSVRGGGWTEESQAASEEIPNSGWAVGVCSSDKTAPWDCSIATTTSCLIQMGEKDTDERLKTIYELPGGRLPSGSPLDTGIFPNHFCGSNEHLGADDEVFMGIHRACRYGA